MSVSLIVRLGSIAAVPTSLESQDVQDDGVTFPAASMTTGEMELHCRQQLAGLPPLLIRQFTEYALPAELGATDSIRLMQWNMLSQGKILLPFFSAFCTFWVYLASSQAMRFRVSFKHMSK